jgi:glycosyltransferase involved in cell wall biosynthesis
MSIDLILSTRNDNASGLRNSLLPLRDLILQDEIVVFVVNDSDRDLLPNSLPVEIVCKVHVVKTQTRLGLAHALNVGAAIGTSEFIARLDVGDWSVPERFLEQRSFLESHDGVGLVGIKSMLNFHDRSGTITRSIVSKGPLSHEQIVGELKKSNPFVHGSIMFRRQCFVDAGGYDESLLVAQDFGLYMRFYHLGFLLAIIEGARHSHAFYEDYSNTLKKNKLSRWNAMKVRIRYFGIAEYFSFPFFFSFLKDLLLLMLPLSFIVFLRGLLR